MYGRTTESKQTETNKNTPVGYNTKIPPAHGESVWLNFTVSGNETIASFCMSREEVRGLIAHLKVAADRMDRNYKNSIKDQRSKRSREIDDDEDDDYY